MPMPFTIDPVSLLIGLAAGGGVAWAVLRQKTAALETELRAGHDARQQMGDQFAALATKAAQDNQQTFLRLAEENFRRLQDGAKADLEKRETAIKTMVEPVGKSLEKMDLQIAALEKARTGSYAELMQNLSLIRDDHEKLRGATASLAQALRSPGTRGKWGELQLQRALEAVGMVETIDFDQQNMLKTDDSFQKPDFIINLTGKRSIIIDAKAPLDAFLEATRVDISEEDRKRALKRHADQVRGHIRTLSSREYWGKLDSPEFVLMYLPGDSYYAAALEADPTLFEAGVESKVFLMTPTTLLPTLRVIAHAWKQEKLAQNAREISALGADLYKRLCTFGAHLEKMGKGLNSALRSFDDAVGSLERTVLPAARKFRDLQTLEVSDTLAAPEPINHMPRQIRVAELLPDEPAVAELKIIKKD
jgi:DNA recombination protein RmuC